MLPRLIDLFSWAIQGWKIADSLHSEVITVALQHALKTGYIASGAIFHSDRGCQYTTSSTRDLLHKLELLQSVSAAGYCYDNTFAESAFNYLKINFKTHNKNLNLSALNLSTFSGTSRFGTHLCLGAAKARLVVRTLLKALCDRAAAIEIVAAGKKSSRNPLTIAA